MSDADWRELASAAERSILAAAGYGHPVRLGSRVALLVVDTTYGFTGREPLPVEESIRDYPSSCGLAAWNAIEQIVRLLATARALDIPVFFSRGSGDPSRVGRWADKRPSGLRQPPDAYDIVAEIAPRPSETVIRKDKPSAFFGTALIELLRERGVDSLVVSGGTTSGCVRATVLDAFSHDLRVTVVEDAVFDRIRLSHGVTLFDLSQKYADVRPTADVVQELEGRQAPAGSEPRAQ